jgi:3-methyladenine DNA glycosylase AlkD
MTTHKQAIAILRELGDPAKASEMHKYHKVDRQYLGVANPVIDGLVKEWRADVDAEARLALAHGLWKGNTHEGRVAAAKVLTQARIRPDDQGAWDLITSWVPDFDAWAIADHVCIAGQKRLVADPARLDTVAAWTTSEHMWTKRAALVMTLPWTKQNHPKPADLAIRDRVLGWAATYVTDHDRFIQKSIAWWLRELSKHDAPRVQDFLAAHGDQMKPSAVREAGRKLSA